MRKTSFLIAVTALSVLPPASASSAVSPPAPPTPVGDLIVSFYGLSEYDSAATAQFQATFQHDLVRIASSLPIQEIEVSSWLFHRVLTGAAVKFSARGRETAFDLVAGRLVRAIQALPYVRFVYLRGNAGDPDAPVDQRSAPGDNGTSLETTPGRLRLLSLTPNPSPSGVLLTYDVPEPGGKLWVRVYDVAGRLMAEPFAGERLPGVWRTYWDATDSRGHAAAAGIYFVQLQMAGRSLARRLVLTR